MTRAPRPRRSRILHGGLLAGAAVVAGAVAVLGAGSSVPADGPRVPFTPTAPPPTLERSTPAPGVTSEPSPEPTLGDPSPTRGSASPTAGGTPPVQDERPGAPPVGVAIDVLGVDAPVIPVGLDAGGGVAVPDDIGVVGWYEGSALIGAQRGSSVLVGHRDEADVGLGALGAIESLAAGDEVAVTVEGGQVVRYVVEEVTYVEKVSFAAIVEDVFDREGSPRLILITCGGAFDDAAGSYLSNVIVMARPVDLLLSTAGGATALP